MLLLVYYSRGLHGLDDLVQYFLQNALAPYVADRLKLQTTPTYGPLFSTTVDYYNLTEEEIKP
jgi:hypothetical protein